MLLIKSAIYCSVASVVGLWIFLRCIRSQYSRGLGRTLTYTLAWCIGVSFFSPNPIVNVILNLFTVPIFGGRKNNIGAVYIFSMLVSPAINYSLGVGGTYLFVWFNFMSVTVGAVIANSLRRERRLSGSTSTYVSIGLIFIILWFVEARGSSGTNIARVGVDIFCNFALPFIAVRSAIRNPEDARRFFVGIASATAALSSLAVYEALHHWPIYRVLADHYGVQLGAGASVKMRGGLLRAPGPFSEPTSFAFWLALGVFIVISSKWMFKSKSYHIVAGLLLLVGLFAPQSRGAYLGLIVGYVTMQLCRGKFRAIVNGGLAVSGASLFLYVGSRINQNIASFVGVNSDGAISKDYRQGLFDRGVEEVTKYPLLGRPLPEVVNSMLDLRQGEGIVDFVNSYLFIALTAGLIGLSVFVFSIYLPLKPLIFIKGGRKDFSNSLAITGIGSLLAIYIMLFFTSLGGRTTVALSVFISFSSAMYAIRGMFKLVDANRNKRIEFAGASPERKRLI